MTSSVVHCMSLLISMNPLVAKKFSSQQMRWDLLLLVHRPEEAEASRENNNYWRSHAYN